MSSEGTTKSSTKNEQGEGQGAVGSSSSVSSGVMSIPSVEFVSDVDSFMSESDHDNNAQLVLRRLEETYSKLKLSEANNGNLKLR